MSLRQLQNEFKLFSSIVYVGFAIENEPPKSCDWGLGIAALIGVVKILSSLESENKIRLSFTIYPDCTSFLVSGIFELVFQGAITKRASKLCFSIL